MKVVDSLYDLMIKCCLLDVYFRISLLIVEMLRLVLVELLHRILTM